MGVRTMGQRIRILNAARDALADGQTVTMIENQTDELTATSSEEGQEEEGLMDNDVEMEGEETGDMEEEEEGGEEEEGEGGEDEEDNGDNGVIIMIIICIILTILNASKQPLNNLLAKARTLVVALAVHNFNYFDFDKDDLLYDNQS